MPYYDSVSDGSICSGEELYKAIPQAAELLGIMDLINYEVQIAYRDEEATMFIKVANTVDLATKQPLSKGEARLLLDILGR